MSGIFIESIQTIVPNNRVEQTKAKDYLKASFSDLKKEEERKIDIVFKRSGISSRYTVMDSFNEKGNFLWGKDSKPPTKERMELYKDKANQLSKACIEQYKIKDLESLDSIISVSCTGLTAPGLEIELAGHLKLSPKARRSSVNFMGCYGFFHALKQSADQLKTGGSIKTLIVATELCSPHFQQKLDESNLLGNAIFADGSASCIISSRRPVSFPHYELIASGQYLINDGQNDLTWNVGNNGFEMVLSSRLPTLVSQRIKEITSDFLNEQEVQLNEIDHFAVHPGGKRILDEIVQSFGAKADQLSSSYKVLSEYGNMSSPTILFVLKDLTKHLEQGEKILALAFGPGFTVEMALLKAHVRN